MVDADSLGCEHAGRLFQPERDDTPVAVTGPASENIDFSV
jgi:hypothetical protein